MNPKDLSMVKSLLTEAEDSAETQRSLVADSMKDRHADFGKFKEYLKENSEKFKDFFPKDEDENKSDDAEGEEEEIVELSYEEKEKQEKEAREARLEKLIEMDNEDPFDIVYFCKDNDEVKKYITKTYAEEGDESGIISRKMELEWFLDNLEDINLVVDSEKELEGIKKELGDEYIRIADYISSEKYNKKKDADLLVKKEAVEKEPDSREKRRKLRQIYVEQNRFSLAFMFERVNDPKIGQKERQSILEAFTDTTRSNYIMNRFYSKCKSFGLSNDVYKYLFNIEEMYLDEKYHPFNNFFLFFAMRYVCYCTENEVTEAKEVVHALLHLVGNRFYSEEPKNLLLDSIRKFLDMFMSGPIVISMKEKNTTWPGHPHRKEMEKEREKALREKFTKTLKEMDESEGEESVDAVDYDAMTVEELRKLIIARNEVEKKKLEEEKAEEEEIDNEELTEDAATEDIAEEADESEGGATNG